MLFRSAVADPTDPDVPGRAALQWLSTRSTEQRDVCRRLADDLPPGVVLSTVDHLAAEPVGLTALAALGEALAPEPPTVSRPDVGPQVSLESGRGLESVYLWRLELPLAEEAGVELSRVEDDLLVGAVGLRRRLTLPPVLRRCTVVDAEVTEGALLVRFAPDPDVWMR